MELEDENELLKKINNKNKNNKAPTNVHAEALGDKQVEITFQAPISDLKLKGYNVYLVFDIKNIKNVKNVKNVKLNNDLINLLINDVNDDNDDRGLCSIRLDCPIGKHSFIVQAVYDNDRVYKSNRSNEVTICTLPQLPSTITAVPTGFSGQIKVLFTVESVIDDTVKPYMYILSCFNTFNGVIQYASHNANATDEPYKIYTFDNLIDDEMYIVAVSSYNIAGNINKTVNVTPIATPYSIAITSVEA